MLQDRQYYAARAVEERRVAMASVSPQARAIHLDLATRYEVLVQAAGDRLPSGALGEQVPPISRISKEDAASTAGILAAQFVLQSDGVRAAKAP